VRYCAIDSQSDEDSKTAPSTARQFDMLNLLVEELRGIGAQDVTLTEYGTVLATVPATANGPTIGFLAHVDTAPAFNATGVKPRVIRGYNGGPIRFPDAHDLDLSPEVSPYLGTRLGHDIVTASGTTLLGADDKSGVAVIMTAARHLIANSDIPHGKIRIAFTTDEEIGRGVNPRLAKDIAADFAYTLDGGAAGEIEYESFSADGAVVRIEGVSVHPGTAKDKLVNALHLGAKIIATLPQVRMTPETTEDREGFIMVYEMRGTAADCEVRLILRDFEQVCDAVAATEPRAKLTCEIRPQYRNMRYWLEKDMAPVELAQAACRDLGVEPRSVPIRGGTDGSRLTEMGVPCPNLFTGMQELHGPREWISVQDMALSTRLVLRLVERAAEKG